MHTVVVCNLIKHSVSGAMTTSDLVVFRCRFNGIFFVAAQIHNGVLDRYISGIIGLALRYQLLFVWRQVLMRGVTALCEHVSIVAFWSTRFTVGGIHDFFFLGKDARCV